MTAQDRMEPKPYLIKARLKYQGEEFTGDILLLPAIDDSEALSFLSVLGKIDAQEVVSIDEMERQLPSNGVFEYEVESDDGGTLAKIGRKLANAGAALVVATASTQLKAWIVGYVAANAPLMLKLLLVAALV